MLTPILTLLNAGCTLGELWEVVSNREPPVSFKLDSPTKSFIWTHLLRCVEEAKTVRIFQLAEPRELVQTTSTHSPSFVEYCHPFPYRLISIPEKGIRGSCASFNTRKDITTEILQEQMDLSTVMEKWVNYVDTCYWYCGTVVLVAKACK